MAVIKALPGPVVSDQLPEALQLGQETLIVMQRVYGEDHRYTGHAADALGSVHTKPCAMRNPSAALPLIRR